MLGILNLAFSRKKFGRQDPLQKFFPFCVNFCFISPSFNRKLECWYRKYYSNPFQHSTNKINIYDIRDGIFHFLNSNYFYPTTINLLLHAWIHRNDIRSLWSVSKIVLIEITYSKPNIPSFPLDPHEPKKKNTSSRPTSTIYNLVQRLSGAIDASESATRTSGYILS